MKNVLVVAAHPDDEILGCGAAMARHAQRGDAVHVLLMAEGITSRDPRRQVQKRRRGLKELQASARKANGLLGVRSVTFHDFPDNRMDSVDLLDVVKKVEQVIAEHRPEKIYTHHFGDVNIDHRRVHEAVVTATRPYPGQPVRSLLYFEVPSSTEWQASSPASAFIPNYFVDATGTLAMKLKALEAYASEMRNWPHPRSLKAIEHLARWRGASVGLPAAEAFVLGRKVAE